MVNIIFNLALLYSEAYWFLEEGVSGYSLTTNVKAYQNLHPYSSYFFQERIVSGASVMVAWFKVFKFLRLNMWLNMMWLTLGRASGFLVGFVTTFLVVMCGFVTLGLLVFGGQMSDYETYDVAITAVFRLILSDFDYSQLKHISPTLAPFFFYFYALVVVFIMLNMFIAIINAAFQDVGRVLADLKEDSTGQTWVEVILGKWAQDIVDRINDAIVASHLEKESKADSAD